MINNMFYISLFILGFILVFLGMLIGSKGESKKADISDLLTAGIVNILFNQSGMIVGKQRKRKTHKRNVKTIVVGLALVLVGFALIFIFGNLMSIP